MHAHFDEFRLINAIIHEENQHINEVAFSLIDTKGVSKILYSRKIKMSFLE